MEPQAKYTLVGASVVVLTTLMVIAMLWLSEVGGLNGAKHFSIYFRRHALYGLQVDSGVTMRGIKVGTVSSLEISDRNIEEIHVVVMLDADAPVKTDTVAVVNRNLLTGFASLDLVRGTQRAELLEDVPDGEEHPVIPEANSELDQIAESVPQMLEQASQVATRVSSALSEENIRSLTKTLQNIEKFTDVLASSNADFEGTMKEIQAAAGDFRKVSRSLSQFTEENNGRLVQVSDEILATLNEVQALMKTFRDQSETLMTSLSATSQVLSQQASVASQSLGVAAQSAATTFEGFQQPRSLITGPHKSALGPGEGGAR